MRIEQRVLRAFKQRFGAAPAHLVRAPGRVNLIGEHTDYNDGFVMPMAINRAIWLALRPRDGGHVTAHSLDFNQSIEFELGDLRKDVGWAE
jgi:galactokinase